MSLDEFTRVVVRTRGSVKGQDQNHSHSFERAVVTLRDRPRFVLVDEEDGKRTMFPVECVRKIVVHPEPGSESRLDLEEGQE